MENTILDTSKTFTPSNRNKQPPPKTQQTPTSKEPLSAPTPTIMNLMSTSKSALISQSISKSIPYSDQCLGARTCGGRGKRCI